MHTNKISPRVGEGEGKFRYEVSAGAELTLSAFTGRFPAVKNQLQTRKSSFFLHFALHSSYHAFLLDSFPFRTQLLVLSLSRYRLQTLAILAVA